MSDFDLDGLLKFERAILVKDGGAPLYKDRTAIIEWSQIPTGASEECRAYLESKLLVIHDVTVGFNKLSGTWRFSKLDWLKDEEGCKVQAHYRFSLYSAWDWTRVELGTPSRLDSDIKFSILRHRHVDPTQVQAFVATAPTEFTNQVTNIGKFEGTWKCVRVRMVQDDDGSAICLLYCAKEGINLSQVDVETSIDIYNDVFTDYYFQVVDPEASGLIIGVGGYNWAPGFTYKKTVSWEAETSLYNVTIEKSVAQEVDGADKSSSATAFDSTASVTDRNVQNAVGMVTTQTAGSIESASYKRTESGVFDNTTEIKTAIAVTGATSTKTIEAFQTSTVVEDRNSTAALTQESEQTPGKIVTTSSKKNEFGIFDNTKEEKDANTIAVQEQSNHSGFLKTDLFQSIAVNKSKNSETRPDLPAFSAGTIIKQMSTENEFQRFDNEVATITANPVASVKTSTTIDSTEKIVLAEDRNQSAATTAPTTASAGTAVRVISDKNEFGLYDNEVETSTAVPLDSGWISHAEQYGTAYVRTMDGYSITDVEAAIADTTGYAGALLNTVQLTPTKFNGLWSARLYATPPRYPTPPATNWGNCETNWMATKDYTVGGVSWRVNVTCGLKQTNSLADASAFCSGSGNTRIESINGGRHFRATFMTITGQPTKI